MTASEQDVWGRLGRRLIVWAAVIGAVLLIPFTAMRFTTEVNWTAFDFIVVAVLLGGVALAFELASLRGTPYYRAGAAMSLAGAAMLFVATGAVGVIGSEDDPHNLIYLAVIGAAFLVALLSGFRAIALSWIMYLGAASLIAIGAVALASGWGPDSAIYPWDLIGATGFFSAIWVASGWLFGQAAQR